MDDSVGVSKFVGQIKMLLCCLEGRVLAILATKDDLRPMAVDFYFLVIEILCCYIYQEICQVMDQLNLLLKGGG